MNLPKSIAITGLGTFLGGQLAERLSTIPDGPRLIALDRRIPTKLLGRVVLHPVDLTAPDAKAQVVEVLQEQRVDVVVHLAFRGFPRSDIEADYQLETLGSQRLVLACSDVGVRRLVVASTTMLYGAHPNNPNFIQEDQPLRGHAHAHCVQNRVAAEKMLAAWHSRYPGIDLTILRHCWVMGPTIDDAVIRHFERSTVPTPLGFDPLLQFVHENDLVDVFEKAILESHPGVFNVVGDGVMPLSVLLARAKKRQLPLPEPLLETVGQTPSQRTSGDRSEGFYDYLRYLFVADGARTWSTFGEPHYSTEEAWMAFVASRLEATADPASGDADFGDWAGE